MRRARTHTCICNMNSLFTRNCQLGYMISIPISTTTTQWQRQETFEKGAKYCKTNLLLSKEKKFNYNFLNIEFNYNSKQLQDNSKRFHILRMFDDCIIANIVSTTFSMNVIQLSLNLISHMVLVLIFHFTNCWNCPLEGKQCTIMCYWFLKG